MFILRDFIPPCSPINPTCLFTDTLRTWKSSHGKINESVMMCVVFICLCTRPCIPQIPCTPLTFDPRAFYQREAFLTRVTSALWDARGQGGKAPRGLTMSLIQDAGSRSLPRFLLEIAMVQRKTNVTPCYFPQSRDAGFTESQGKGPDSLLNKD